MSSDELVSLSKTIKDALLNLGEIEELNGKYFDLETDDNLDEYQELDDDNQIFTPGETQKVSGSSRNFPKGRGVYVNADRTLIIWVNEQDHIRVFSMEKGNDLKSVYNRIMNVDKILNENLTFATHDKYGYLTVAPNEIGNTVRISMQVKLP